MRLLPRYVLIELIKVFAVTLASLTLLMMIVGVAKEALDQGLGLLHIVKMMPYILPNALVFALPGSMLFAASVVFGRMSGANEIVAIKSLGINPMVLMWPAYIFAFLLSLSCVWLNDLAVSWGFNNVQRVAIEALDDIVYGMLTRQKSFNSKRFSINVRRVEGRRLIQPRITIASGSNSAEITIIAEEAEIQSDLERHTLAMVCRNGVFQSSGVSYRFDHQVQEIPLREASGKAELSHHPAHVRLQDVPAEIALQRGVIDKLRQEMAAQAVFALATGDTLAMAAPHWEAHRRELEHQQGLLSRFYTEAPRRWANGFSCLCFVLIGAPMAIRLRNSDVLTSFFACFLPILLVYYPLLIYGVDRAKDGVLPVYSVWMGNIILSLWGLWLMRRVIRF